MGLYDMYICVGVNAAVLYIVCYRGQYGKPILMLEKKENKIGNIVTCNYFCIFYIAIYRHAYKFYGLA